MKRIILIILFIASNFYVFTQPKCYIEHYGIDDGLPQHTVMDIIQDQKGFMWFSTWDGLSKFDGYNFYSYKIQHGDAYHMRSSRIDFICEDKYGHIWTLPYDKEPHRFDPKTETFMGLHSLDEYKDIPTMAKAIKPVGSGKVWIISEEKSCICIIDSTFKVRAYNELKNNKVNDVYEDKELNSWILTDNGLYKETANNEDFIAYFTDNADDFLSVLELSSEIWFGLNNGNIQVLDKRTNRFNLQKIPTSSDIKFLFNVGNNHILIATQDDGFFIYNKLTKQSDHYNIATLPDMKSNKILSCYIDRGENIWFELDYTGAAKFNIANRKMKHFEMKLESRSATVYPPNFFIFEDIMDRLWVHPRGGGFSYYNPVSDELVPFYNEPYSADWKFSNMMHSAFSDKQGNLWLSTRSHGLDKVVFQNDVFKTVIVDPNIHSSINNDIRVIFEDNERNLWVSTKGGKIYVYDSTGKQTGYLCENGTIGYGVPIDGFCYSIMQDSKQNIWIGTKGEGIYKLIPADNAGTYNISHYKHNPDNVNSLSNSSVYNIFEDVKGRIWVGTYGGGLNLIEGDRDVRFVHCRNGFNQYPIQAGSQIRVISSDKFGNICIGTTLGLIMFSPDFNSVSDIKFKSYTRIPGDNQSLSGNDIYDICTTSGGETYLATFGGGINKITETDKEGFPLKFGAYTINNGLPSDVILSVIEDTDNKLWVISEGTITKFDPKQETFETYSEINRLIKGLNFSEGARFSSESGIIYAGYSKGFLSIETNRIIKNLFKPYVALTKFQIANKNVAIGEDTPLKASIDNTKELKLNNKQRLFSIEFAALDYTDSKNITYAYKLDDFDKDWIITQKQRTANYSNMQPGKYTFKVRSTNSDGIWTDNEHSLRIEIVPTFWQTRWAYLLYFIVFVVLLYIALRIIFTFYRLKDRVKLEQEQTEMRTRFFIDISHEIRTPLTMIVSPIENIVENEQTPISIKDQLRLVLKNANRMLKMVNQILDFRKIQKQKLNIQETPIGLYISEICSGFAKSAEVQGVNLNVDNQVGTQTLWIDRDSFEKLLYNLLSNAFKYTPEGKSIDVIISEKDNMIALTVKDEGLGMSREMQNKLFTRFVSFNKDKTKPSTGIGLSIVKEVADKHKAIIQVNSDINKGSSFTVLFHKGASHYNNEDITIGNQVNEESAIPANPEINKPAEQKQTILVAEDDSDLRGFIKTVLQDHYSVLEAANGKEALDIALSQYPDFILSDIMMPEMDGIELLQQIRKNNTTSHIPFILLTAKTNIESKLEGMEYGADDYINKPFSVRYLRARIENIIRMRQNLLYKNYSIHPPQAIVEQEEVSKEESKAQITPQDERFLEKIKSTIELNIDNSDFLIEDLVSEVGMSRTVFFKKLKSLTGMAPVEFIRDIKIRYAAELIGKEQYAIKEIAFMVGFSDTKYFTQRFKQIFGITPGEYRKKNFKN